MSLSGGIIIIWLSVIVSYFCCIGYGYERERERYVGGGIGGREGVGSFACPCGLPGHSLGILVVRLTSHTTPGYNWSNKSVSK